MTASSGSERTVDVWHDEDGRIVAWGHVPAGAPEYLRARPIAGEGRAVLSVSVAEDDLAALHETHVVDTASGRVRRRDGRG